MAPHGAEPGFFGTLCGFLDFGLGEVFGDEISEFGAVDDKISVLKVGQI